MGEFQELIFEVRILFRVPLDSASYDVFIDVFIDLIESRQLIIGGMGGRFPLTETDGMIATGRRGSPSEQDRQTLLVWLQERPEIAQAEVGDFVDAWYGWDEVKQA